MYVWLLQRITSNQKKYKIASLDTIAFLDKLCIYKQPILTHYFVNMGWQRGWIGLNYDIIVHILYSYLRYTDRLLDLFFLLLAVILSEFHEKPRRKDLVAEKVHRRICGRNITFLAARPSSYIIFVVFFVHSDFTKEKKIAPENAVGAVKNQEEKIGLQKKVHRRICVSDATFFGCTSCNLYNFCCFFVNYNFTQQKKNSSRK